MCRSCVFDPTPLFLLEGPSSQTLGNYTFVGERKYLSYGHKVPIVGGHEVRMLVVTKVLGIRPVTFFFLQ